MNFEQLTQSDSSLAFYADAPLWEGQSCGAIGQFDFKSVEDGLVLIQHAVNRAIDHVTALAHALELPLHLR